MRQHGIIICVRLVTSSGACGHTGGCLCEGNRGSLTVVDFCYKVGSEVMINLSGRSDPGTCVCVCVCVCGRCWWTYSGAAAAAVLSCNKFIML